MKRILNCSLCAVLILSCGGRKAADYDRTAAAYGKSAYTCFRDGNFTEAAKLYRRALISAGKSDMPYQRARYLFNIGRVYLETGKFDSAQQYFILSHDEFMFLGDSSAVSSAAAFICLAYICRGEIDSARMVSRMNYPGRDQALWGMVQGRLLMTEGKVSGAETEFRGAALKQRKKRNFAGLALNCYYRGSLALSSRDFQRGRELFDSSLALLDRVPERYNRYRVLLGYSKLEFCSGTEQGGLRYYRRAQECVPEGIRLPALDELKSCSDLRE
jgi:tetratricopeptide (TPR) repeat protein